MTRPVLRAMPATELTTQAHFNERLRDVLRYVQANSAFYQQKWEGHWLPSCTAELSFLPVLTKHELMEQSSHEGGITAPILTRPANGSVLFLTGGTTDHATTTLLDPHELDEALRNGISLHPYIYEPGDRVVICTGQFCLWSGFPYNLMKWPRNSDVVTLPMGSAAPDQMARTFTRFRPTVAAGLGGMVLTVLREAYYGGADISCLRVVQYAGMPLDPISQKEIEAMVGHKVIFVSCYSATEAWSIADAVDVRHPNHLYLNNNTWVEVVDPETLQPLEDGEEGMFLLTRLVETLWPMVRYMIGDLGRIIPYSEVPESKRLFPNARIIELKGRKEEFILNGLKLNPKAIQQLLLQVFTKAQGLQLHLYHEGDTLVFETRMEMEDPSEGEYLYGEYPEYLIRKALKDYMPDYPVSDEVGAQDFLGGIVFKAVYVPFGGLEATNVGKIRPLIDRRKTI